MMLILYTEQSSPRLSYVIETLFEDILNQSVLITTDRSRLDANTPSINYSRLSIPDIPFIRPHSLLFEQGTRILSEAFDPQGNIFPCESDLVQQDLFAASFLLLSRYEEYVTQERDEYGRFQATDSMMMRAGLLEQPLVDQWAIQIWTALRKRYPVLKPIQREFKTLATFDIDVAYEHKGKGLWRGLKARAKDLIAFRFNRMKERNQVLKGLQRDPYDSYAYQQTVLKKHEIESRYFFLLGDKSKYDHNVSHRQSILQALIRNIDGWSSIGIHPSMKSNLRFSQLKKELKRLQKITSKPVTRSRQHFLYLNLPETYRNLVKLGIAEDYSMGYADHVGFRAGTCSMVRWYDLMAEQTSPLYLIPITAMDSTLRDYMQLSPSQANACLNRLRKGVKDVGGLYVPLWHNHTIHDQGDWSDWNSVFTTSLGIGLEEEASA